MKRIIQLLTLTMICIVLTSCASKKKATAQSTPSDTAQTETLELKPIALVPGRMLDSRPVGALQRMIIYRLTGPYQDLVPIVVRGEEVRSYPAPSDLTDNSHPIDLGNGYLLDRRGVGPMSVLTDLTYEQYRALQHVSPRFLLDHIKVRSPFAEMYDCGEVTSLDPARAKAFIENGFKGCTQLIGTAPRILPKDPRRLVE